jgi:hypothetical protein
VTVPRAQRVAVFPGPNRPGRETKAEPRRPGENVVSVLEDPKYAEDFAFGLEGDSGVTMIEEASA